MKKFLKYLVVFEQLMFSGFSFLISLALGKYLDNKEEFGAWVLFNSMLFFFLSILSSVFWQSFVVNYLKKENPTEKVKYQLFTIVGSVFLSIFASVITLLIVGFKLADGIQFSSFGLFVLFGFLFLVYELFRRVFIAKKASVKLFTYTFLRVITGVVLGLGVIFFFDKFNLTIALSVLIIAYLVAFLFAGVLNPKAWLISKKLIKEKKEEGKSIFKEDWKENKWLFGKNFVHYFTSQLYILLLAFMIDISAPADFESVRLLLQPVTIITMGFSNMLIPMLVGYYKKGPKFFVKKFTLVIGAWCFMIASILLGIIFFAQEIEQLFFGGKFYSEEFVLNLKIFSIAVFCSGVLPILTNLYIILEENKKSFNISLLVFFLNLVVAPLLIIYFGLKGAMIGTSFVQSMLFILNVFVSIKLLVELSKRNENSLIR